MGGICHARLLPGQLSRFSAVVVPSIDSTDFFLRTRYEESSLSRLTDFFSLLFLLLFFYGCHEYALLLSIVSDTPSRDNTSKLELPACLQPASLQLPVKPVFSNIWRLCLAWFISDYIFLDVFNHCKLIRGR